MAGSWGRDWCQACFQSVTCFVISRPFPRALRCQRRKVLLSGQKRMGPDIVLRPSILHTTFMIRCGSRLVTLVKVGS